MNSLRDNNINMITLDVRISCDTFWNYKCNIPIRIADYYNPNDRANNAINNNMNTNTRRNINVASDICDIDNIGRIDPRFELLETYLVEHMIQLIYDDLVQTRQQRDIPILLKKARKFHIHGRTLEDLLFPNGSGGGDTHAMPENTVYICTHC
jgi:hypothetical protein